MRLGFSPAAGRMLDLEGCYRLAAELELDFIELSHDVHEIAPALQDVGLVRELAAATGVGATVHLSYVDLNLASLSPTARRAAVDRTLQGLEYAHAVDAHCGVLHPGRVYIRHPLVDPLVLEALDASLAALRGSDVPVALENIALSADDAAPDPALHRDFTVRHGLGNCLDFGHAFIQENREGRPLTEEYLKTMTPQLIHLHVHNNHGATDEHLPTDEGGIDYAGLIGHIADFDGTICLEIATGEAGIRATVAHLRGLAGAAS